MKRLAGMIVAPIASIALATGCTTGSVGDDTTPGDDGSSDEVVCSADLTLTGTFAVTDPQPAEIGGCWPVGNWQFTASVTNNTCATAPQLAPSYAFSIARDLASPEPDYNFTMTVTAPSDPAATIGIQSSASGCTGLMAVYSADGKTYQNLHPAQQGAGSTTLIGHGTWEVHTTDQRPQAP